MNDEYIARENRAVNQAQLEARQQKTWGEYLRELDEGLVFWLERAHA